MGTPPAITLPSAPLGAQGQSAWALRIEGTRVALVLARAPIAPGFALDELVIDLPHVSLPFDFREGIAQFRDCRGRAASVVLDVEARALLDWLHQVSLGEVSGRAVDDTLCLVGRLPEAHYIMRARLVAPEGEQGEAKEPELGLSLYDIRAYGRVEVPWPALASRVLGFVGEPWLGARTLTSARLRGVRGALCWVLSGLGWKLPELAELAGRGIELREGSLRARYERPDLARRELVTLDGMPQSGVRDAFERFVEDLELKRHHGQIDRLILDGALREALAEVYRALDGPPRPGFLAERLLGLCVSQPVLHDEGEATARQLLAKAPEWIPAWAALGSIAEARGRLVEAAAHYERLAGLLNGPQDREESTLVDLAITRCLRATDPEAAEQALARILVRSPDHEEALAGLAELADRRGDEGRALALGRRLLFSARGPERTRAAGLRLVRHALQKGDLDDARVFLSLVLEACPGDPDTLSLAAELEERSGRAGEAMRILEGLLSRLPLEDAERLARGALDLVGIARRAGDLARARRGLWRVTEARALRGSLLVPLVEASLEVGDLELGRRLGQGLDPRDPDEAALLARVRAVSGKLGEALDLVIEAHRAHPGHGAVLELMHGYAFRLGLGERLARELRAVLREQGPEARVLLALGRALEALELRGDAIEPYAQVLELGPSPEAQEVAPRLCALYAEYGQWEAHQALCARLLEQTDDAGRRLELLLAQGHAAFAHTRDLGTALQAAGEAMELAPRALAPAELGVEVLEALGREADLMKVLKRLEAVHPEARGRLDAQLRLIRLQVGRGEVGQARATLARVPLHLAADPRVRVLAERVEGTAAAKLLTYEDAVRAADAGDLAKALEMTTGLLEREPAHVPALELSRWLAQAVGDTPRGLASGEALVELQPDPETRKRLLGELSSAARAAQDPRADRYAAELARLVGRPADPEPDVAAHFERGDRLDGLLSEARAQAGQGAWSEAARALEQALALDPDSMEALELQADALRRLQRWEALSPVLARLADTAFEADETARWTRELGFLWLDQLGDPDRAAEVIARYAAWQSLDERSFDFLAAHYATRGASQALDALWVRRGEAVLEAAVPDRPEMLVGWLRTVVAAGRTTEAKQAWEVLRPLLLKGPLEAELEALVHALVAAP
jgi:tetratricopeptide (TPR) repeat protein